MSAMYFTSHAGSVHLPGAERFRLIGEVNRYAAMQGVGEGPDILPGPAQLNAVLKIGTDLAILMARLVAQVELIVWVDGPGRAWLASIVRQGLSTGLLPAEAGWPAVAEHLVLDEAEPVFIWASNGEHFPSPEGWEGTAEEWEGLGPELQWLHAEAQLRNESAREDATSHLAAHPTLVAAPFSRELRQSNWRTFFFADSIPA